MTLTLIGYVRERPDKKSCVIGDDTIDVPFCKSQHVRGPVHGPYQELLTFIMDLIQQLSGNKSMVRNNVLDVQLAPP